MSKKTLISIQFSVKKETIKIGTGSVVTTQKGPTGVGLSSLRPANSTVNSVTVSSIAKALDSIENLTGVATTNEGTYFEFIDNSSSMPLSCFVTNGAIRWSDQPTISTANSLALLLYVTTTKDFPVTSLTMSNVLSQLRSSGTVEYKDILRLCDDFYYETKDKYCAEVEINENLSIEEIKQADRNGAFTVNDLYEKNEFENINSAKRCVSEPTESKNTGWDAMKNGDYQFGYEWSDEQLSHIPDPSILDNYIPTEEFFSLADKVKYEITEVLQRLDNGKTGISAIGDNFVNAILLGKPGTGKTTLVEAIGAAFGLPVRTIITSKNTEEDNYEGKTKVVDGEFKFCETAFLDVYKNGGIAVVEEFNLADPAVIMGSLGQALVAPFVLMEDGYKEIHRHPLCIIVATMNTATQGSREPNEALTSRFPKVLLMDDPKKKDFINILMSKGNKKNVCEVIYDIYDKMVSYLKESSFDSEAMSLTVRQCFEALKDIKRGVPVKKAVRDTLVNTLAIKDVALAKEVYDSVVEPFPVKI